MRGAAALTGAEKEEFNLSPGADPAEAGVPAEMKRDLAKGSSALGVAIVLERGFGFLANILAARWGGTGTFGAYSLAVSTANNISTYAGGGIGSTAARFSGKYPRGSAGYSTLARVLAVVSLVSAFLAAGGLWIGAKPIAELLHKPNLTGLLHWTAVSAVGIILLECARGFFVGQSRLVALVLLSLIVAAGMLLLIPLAALKHNPVHMIVLQGVVTSSAVCLCLALAKPLGLTAPDGSEAAIAFGPMLREVWSFGFVQLAGLIGVNLAGWWLTTLVARGDTTLVQMSFFAISSQLRNIASLAPSLLTESSYAVMAKQGSGPADTPHQVMALCTYASTFAAVLLAAVGMLVIPWALKLIYGQSYVAATLPVAIALAVAVVHMGSASASARLSILSVRVLGVVNTVWAVFVAVSATLFMLHGGTAWKAMLIYLFAHLAAAAITFAVVSREEPLPKGMSLVFSLGCGVALTLAGLAWVRVQNASLTDLVSVLMLIVSTAGIIALVALGRKYRWLPSATDARGHLSSVSVSIRSMFRVRMSGSSR